MTLLLTSVSHYMAFKYEQNPNKKVDTMCYETHMK